MTAVVPLETAPRALATGLLAVEALRVQFATAKGWLTVVDDVGFSVGPAADAERGGCA